MTNLQRKTLGYAILFFVFLCFYVPCGMCIGFWHASEIFGGLFTICGLVYLGAKLADL